MSGLSGFALGVEGERAGWLYDVFVSQREDPKSVPGMLALAVEQGARQLVTYEHPFFELFFSHFGFRTRTRVSMAQLRNPPREWTADIETQGGRGPDYLCMVKTSDGPATVSALASDTGNFAARPGMSISDASCVHCSAPVPRLRWPRILDAYQCQRCGFLAIAGELAVAQWSRPKNSMDSDGNDRDLGAPGTSFACGSDLLR